MAIRRGFDSRPEPQVESGSLPPVDPMGYRAAHRFLFFQHGPPRTGRRGAMTTDLSAVDSLLQDSQDRDNPSAGELHRLLDRTRTVAVVGLSRDPEKAARRVPSYLAAKGLEVIPVNPNATRILGRDARHSLDEVKEPVDLVLVFRPSEEAGEVVKQAAAREEEPIIWLQEGILAPEATDSARAAGISVVQDLCIFKVHRSLPPGLS